MKNFFVTILLAVSLTATTACAKDNSRGDAIKKMQALTEQLTQDTSNYTDEDWEKISEQFEEVSRVIEENKGSFTPEERAQIDNLRAKCVGLFAAKAMQKATEAMGIAVQHLGGVMEGFLSGLGAVNEKAVGKSISGVFEALGSTIEKTISQVEANASKIEQMGDSINVMGEKMGASFEAIGKSLEAIGESMEKRFEKRK